MQMQDLGAEMREERTGVFHSLTDSDFMRDGPSQTLSHDGSRCSSAHTEGAVFDSNDECFHETGSGSGEEDEDFLLTDSSPAVAAERERAGVGAGDREGGDMEV